MFAVFTAPALVAVLVSSQRHLIALALRWYLLGLGHSFIKYPRQLIIIDFSSDPEEGGAALAVSAAQRAARDCLCAALLSVQHWCKARA